MYSDSADVSVSLGFQDGSVSKVNTPISHVFSYS